MIDDWNTSGRKNLYGMIAMDKMFSTRSTEPIDEKCRAAVIHLSHLRATSGDLSRLLRRARWRRHEFRTHGVGNRLPHNLSNGLQRRRIQFPASDTRDRR